MNTASQIEIFGHSHASAYGTSSQEFSWGAQLATALGAVEYPLASNNLVLCAQGNGYARYIRPASGRRPARNGAYGYPAAADLCVFSVGLGDLAANMAVGSNRYPGAFQQALRALIAFSRLSAFYGAEPSGGSDSSIAYSGTWVDSAATDRNVGTGVRYSTTNGSAITITVPSSFHGGEIDLFWIPLATLGSGVIDIAITGATNTSTTVTTDNTWCDQVTTLQANYAVTRLRDLKPGAHTITATGRSLGYFGFDGWGIVARRPPNVVVCSQMKAPQAQLESFLGSFAADTPTAATIDWVNSVILGVADEFHRCTYHERPDVIMEQINITADGIHPNDAGHRMLAEAIIDHVADLEQLPPAPGPNPVAVTYAANWSAAGGSYATPSYTVRRDRRIRLQGRIARTGSPTPPETLFTLPERHRPASTASFVCNGSTGSPVVDIASTGVVSYRSGSLGSGGTIDLDGCEFTIDAAT